MTKIDKKLIDILVCPVSKGSLEQIGDELISVSYTHLTLPTTPYV